MGLTVYMLHVNLPHSFDVLGEFNSEKSREEEEEEERGEVENNDLSENGEHAVKRVSEQSVQS